jgi:hypothetical protein
MEHKKYKIVSALNYNKVLEISPYAKKVFLMDDVPNNPNQLFYLRDNIHSKNIISIVDQICIKSGGQKQLEANQLSGSSSEDWIFL